ncbi:hypothetical protein CBER1_05069 [Cercospora berteroae]|uniref:Uncharacterized protein n=1 Tax=Cercospora berteroae TaxID=357750 RepID=A0A2S6BRK8_9PEZI|nr:hypothetical protein CBER1_05069 [Cercospora berteroae]
MRATALSDAAATQPRLLKEPSTSKEPTPLGHNLSGGASDAAVQGAGGGSRGPPLSNFPLPRELRDQIYEYLLVGEHAQFEPNMDQVRAEPNTSQHRDENEEARAYDLETAILAVNKAIHQEAIEVFHNKNDFILVTVAWGSAPLYGAVFQLPVITLQQKHVENFKSHACHVEFRCTREGQESIEPGVSLITLAQDLPHVVNMMKWLTFGLSWDMETIPNGGGSEIWQHTPSVHDTIQISVMVVTRSSKYRNQDQFITRPAQNPLLKKVLSHIKPMVFPGQKAILYHWTSANAIIRHNLLKVGLTREIGATRVWPQAFLGSLLDLILQRKGRADGLLRAGYSELAVQEYLEIIRSLPRYESDLLSTPGCTWLSICILQTILDLSATAMFTLAALDKTHTTDFHDARIEGASYARDTLFAVPMSTMTLSVDTFQWYFKHSVHHAYAMDVLFKRETFPSPLNNGPNDSVSRTLDMLQHLWINRGGPANDTDDHLGYDLEFLEYLNDDTAARANFMSGQLSNDHILYQLSYRNLGPRVISSPMPKALEALRSNVVRWTDTSAEEKYFGRESNTR